MWRRESVQPDDVAMMAQMQPKLLGHGQDRLYFLERLAAMQR